MGHGQFAGFVQQQCFVVLAGADVGPCHALDLRSQCVVRGTGFEVHPGRRTVAAQHLQLALLRQSGAQQGLTALVVDVLVGAHNESAHILLDQFIARQVQHRRRGEVGLQNQALFVDRAIANGGQIKQVKVARARAVQLLLGVAQLLVLHFQFNLVHLQFVQKLAYAFAGLGLAVAGDQFGFAGHAGFRQAAQGHGVDMGHVDGAHGVASCLRSVVATAYIRPPSSTKAVDVTDTFSRLPSLASRCVR